MYPRFNTDVQVPAQAPISFRAATCINASSPFITKLLRLQNHDLVEFAPERWLQGRLDDTIDPALSVGLDAQALRRTKGRMMRRSAQRINACGRKAPLILPYTSCDHTPLSNKCAAIYIEGKAQKTYYETDSQQMHVGVRWLSLSSILRVLGEHRPIRHAVALRDVRAERRRAESETVACSTASAACLRCVVQ
jgi:hypothetical protein